VKSAPHNSAFTLIEMLVVISIIGILAAITMPVVANFRKADSMLAATRQLQDDVERARMLAISQRTKVYMVFCPSYFWNDPAYLGLPQSEKNKAAKLLDKQLAAYTFVTLRSVGNQPGQENPRYLSEWRTLPQGAIIPLFKFNPRGGPTNIVNALTGQTFPVKGFDVRTDIPFPSPDAPPSSIPGRKYVALPYIGFNHLGQLLPQVGKTQEESEDEYIPLAKGNVNPALDVNKIPQQLPPDPKEQPPGNGINAFTLVHIERLTGRARLEKQEFQ